MLDGRIRAAGPRYARLTRPAEVKLPEAQRLPRPEHRPASRSSPPARDGFLRLHDIYNLNLNADLVVLSGCRTALGRDVRGEGLLGLTRGFLYAGSPRVMANLWPVRDRATAELMQRFYRALFHDGLPPSAALRAAQRALRRDVTGAIPTTGPPSSSKATGALLPYPNRALAPGSEPR
ncbi:MAG: CHAT domain-containing protein [Thermoanaerobaculia bacterium]